MGATKRPLTTNDMPHGAGGNMEHTWKAYELTVIRTWSEKVGPRIESPQSAVNYFKDVAQDYTQESLWVLSVDGRNNMIGVTQVFKGTATGTSVSIADLLRPALLTGAVGFIMVHNHPSGDSEPSDQDINLTEEVLRACGYHDLTLLDHLVIGDNQFASIRSQKPNIWAALSKEDSHGF
jgi:DNA repair protein RadC